ncbi:sensor histidine kinase [Piscinibacter terrae]|uniref:Sensor histidine kinase n=1 Tax=Piscinibacter terrae TaxID=2496871 RepID=A0A3N7HK50_9BURK|nr:histidine kinase [Albitalea terrae]RQP21913.1 sensor histidine kinase [Albitalea terrae]
MADTTAPLPAGLARVIAWPRVRYTVLAALPFALLHLASTTPLPVWAVRTVIVGLLAMLAFGLCEQWPARLPSSMPRWAWQLIGVETAIPLGGLVAYWVTTGEWQFWLNPLRVNGCVQMVFTGWLFAPWIALGAMVKQREELARTQALAFQLERSELERQALDARMRLLQAQVQPHFLFNTLANVRALVRSNSPQTPAVLDSLIAYLRAAVPRLDENASTLSQEIELVRAYLELMRMRMPDRLQYSLHADDAALPLRCPPMALHTLVENAVRHGIDPGEEGGRVDIVITVREGRCVMRVTDTGVGLQAPGDGLGTGLSTLRERMQLAFAGDARLSLTGVMPHGVCAELEFPAQGGGA